jgi:hypothetical protein
MVLSEFHAEVQQTAEDPRIHIAVFAPDEIRALPLLAAVGEGAILAGQRGPRRQW